VIFALR